MRWDFRKKKLRFSATFLAIPRARGLLGHADATPVEPFVRALVVVARHHVAVAHAPACTVLTVVALALAVVVTAVRSVIFSLNLAQRALFARVRRRGFEVPSCRGGRCVIAAVAVAIAERGSAFFTGASPRRFLTGRV